MGKVNPEALLQLVNADLLAAGYDCTADKSSAVCSKAVAATLLSRVFIRKLKDRTEKEARSRAIALFEHVNSRIVEEYTPRSMTDDDQVLIAIGEARKYIFELFPQHRFLSIDPHSGTFGPGIIIGSEPDIASKLTSCLSFCNTDVLKFWNIAASASPTSWALEKVRAKNTGYTEVKASKLTTVSKTVTIDRVICVEPTANAFMQQAIRHHLEAILKRKCGIDLSTQQEVQRKLARKGSISGELSTIDLSSASDTIGYSFCKYMLPPDLFAWLDTCRTPSTKIDGREVKLKMMSSMGNATTFPLQTILFLAIIIGVYRVLNIRPNTKRSSQNRQNCGVNGDDLIVCTSAYQLVCKTLTACGFIVNLDKSFGSGLFRESCGGDYHSGVNVRGVYIKSLRTRTAVYVAHNRLRKWSLYHNIPLPGALKYLRDSVSKRHVVPEYMNDDAGFHSDGGPFKGKYLDAVSKRKKLPSHDGDLLLNVLLASQLKTDDESFWLDIRSEEGGKRYRERTFREHNYTVLPSRWVPDSIWDVREDSCRYYSL